MSPSARTAIRTFSSSSSITKLLEPTLGDAIAMSESAVSITLILVVVVAAEAKLEELELGGGWLMRSLIPKRRSWAIWQNESGGLIYYSIFSPSQQLGGRALRQNFTRWVGWWMVVKDNSQACLLSWHVKMRSLIVDFSFTSIASPVVQR